MKKQGYEVVAQKPVCVDFSDGRAISFRPGHRFEADVHNTSVQRLLKVGEIRALSPREMVPVMPVTLGRAPAEAQILKTRASLAEQKRVSDALAEASAKMAASKAAPPKIEQAKTPVAPKAGK